MVYKSWCIPVYIYSNYISNMLNFKRISAHHYVPTRSRWQQRVTNIVLHHMLETNIGTDHSESLHSCERGTSISESKLLRVQPWASQRVRIDESKNSSECISKWIFFKRLFEKGTWQHTVAGYLQNCFPEPFHIVPSVFEEENSGSCLAISMDIIDLFYSLLHDESLKFKGLY